MGFDKKLGGDGGGGMFIKLGAGDSVTGVVVGEPKVFEHTWKDGRTQKRFKVNFVVNENGAYTAKILEQGVSVYDKLVELNQSGYELNRTVVKISRKGSGLNTEYSVVPVPGGNLEGERLDNLLAVSLLPLDGKKEDKGDSPADWNPPAEDDGDEDPLPF